MSLLRIYRTTSHQLPRVRQQQFSSTSFRRQTSITVPRHPVAIPYTDTCPSPTCECTATTPADLDIDRKSPLLNTVAAYAEQVVICTGQEDWASRIENDEGETGDFVRGLKGVIGKGSAAFDVGWFSLSRDFHECKDRRHIHCIHANELLKHYSRSITSS